jgi:hypothetical protein
MKAQLRKIASLLIIMFIQVLPAIQEELFWVFNDKG